MEKQPAKATGQQDTNAALAALAAAGNSFALGPVVGDQQGPAAPLVLAVVRPEQGRC